jgi:hypothetical protein
LVSKHADLVAAILGEPQAILIVHKTTAIAREFGLRR